MTGQGCMVGLYVELEVINQIVLLEEIQRRGSVKIILMLGRFAGFGLYEELSLESDLLFVFNCHLKEPRHLFLLFPDVGIQERLISFTPSPENVILTSKFMSSIDGVLHLSRGVGHDMRIGACGGTLSVHRISKEIRCPPEELCPGFLL